MLTKTREKIFRAINEYIKKEGISPTVREICGLTGLKSTSTVHIHLKILEEEGYISTKKDSPRSIRILKNEEL